MSDADSRFDGGSGCLTWICLGCEEPVAGEQIHLPDECPECGRVDFGRLASPTASNSERGTE